MRTFRREEQSAVRAQAWGWRRLCGGISTQDWNLRDEGKKWEGGQEKNVRIRQLTCKILERTSISWGSGKSRKRKAGAFPARSVMAFENFINSFVVHACRIRGCGLHCYFLPLCTRRQWEWFKLCIVKPKHSTEMHINHSQKSGHLHFLPD